MGTQSDEELATASADGDRGAYADLVGRHSRLVFAVCLGLVGTFEDAEDLAQETFVRGFRQLKQLKDHSRFRAWIVSIARNLSVEHLRREKRAKRVLFERKPYAVEDYSDLHDAMDRLPEKYRLPLVLYYFDGRSSESVARTLEISPAGVLTRLSRARRELRRLLSVKEAGYERSLRKRS